MQPGAEADKWWTRKVKPMVHAEFERIKEDPVRNNALWRESEKEPRLYVYFPLPRAAAIGLEPGEEVQWELLERGELHLVRAQVPRPQAKARRRATA